MAETNNTKGVTSLILGIVSVVLSWVPFIGLVSGIIGIVLGVKQKRESPNGMATAGFIISIIGTIVSGFYMIFWLFWGAAVFSIFSAASSFG